MLDQMVRVAAALSAAGLCLTALSIGAGCAERAGAVDAALLPAARAPNGMDAPAAGLPAAGGSSGPEIGGAAPITIDTRDHPRGDANPWTGPVRDVEEVVGEEEVEEHRPRLPGGRENSFTLGGVLPDPRATPGTQFAGIPQTEWIPPDATIAVGPEHIVTTVNMKIAFYGKAGDLQYVNFLSDAGDPGFFEPAGAGWFTFDPKCFYDALAERFVVIALERDDDEAWMCLAVSDDADPNGRWHIYRIDAVVRAAGRTHWWDYPGFGYDAQAYYVTGNLFGLSEEGWGGAAVRILEKQRLLDGRAARYWTLRDGNSASVQVAQHAGPTPTPYFVSLAAQDRLRVHAVRDPITAPQLVRADVTVPRFDLPTRAPARGGRTLSLMDARLLNAHWRDGSLYTAHHVGVGDGRNLARWYRLETRGWPASGGPVLVECGEIDPGPGLHSYFPAITANAAGRVALTHGVSSAATPIALAITGRDPDDPPGTMGAPVIVRTSAADGGGRWGDYYDVAPDPADDRFFWAVGELAEASGWACWIASFTIEPPCPADFSDDGVLNSADMVLFIDAWSRRHPRADFDRDGRVATPDIVAYLGAWAAGCP